MSGVGSSCGGHPGRLLIRVDAGPQIGAGHLVRCLALGQSWLKTGGELTLATAASGTWGEAWVRPAGIPMVSLGVEPGTPDDGQATARLARALEARWVVVDGYHFTSAYQQDLKRSGLRLLLIDDLGGAGRYYADVVLNQNLHAQETLYADREPYTALLLGTRYTLLRQEFLAWQGWVREIPEVARRVLVTLGGGDSGDALSKIVEALRHVDVEGVEAIVLGVDAAPGEGVGLGLGGSAARIRFRSHEPQMAEVMTWADVAVAAGGTTCWELAFMGLPALVVSLADNQRPVTERLGEAGAVVNLGWHADITSGEIAKALQRLLTAQPMRAEMNRRGRLLVDGDGAGRVVTRLVAEMLSLRPATEADCRLLWEWANEATARMASFSSAPIAWESHVAWFRAKITDPECLLFIAVDDRDVPMGQVRFDLMDREAVISVSLDARRRGTGYGSALISRACRDLLAMRPVDVIHAHIKPDNAASLRAFAKAGFTNEGRTVIREQQAVRLSLKRGEDV